MGEGESSSVSWRIQSLWMLRETGLAFPSPVGREGQGEGRFARNTPAARQATWSALREDLIEEQVNHHPSHRNVHPDRPRPAGDFLVKLEALLDSPVQRDQHERDNRNRQRQVTEQD